MANVRILGTSHADGVTLTATSEALPVSNLQDRSVKRKWRSTSTADQTITAPFGSSKNVSAIHLENVNASSDAWYVLQLSDDNFATIKYSESFQKWDKDLLYKAATLWLSGSSGGNRIVDANGDRIVDANGDTIVEAYYNVSVPVSATDARLLVADADNADGYMEIGRLKIGDYFDAPNSKNVSVGPSFGYNERAQLIRTRGGGWRSQKLKPARQVTVSWVSVADADAWTIDDESVAELMEHVGVRDDVLIAVYPGEGTDRERRHTILGAAQWGTLDGNFNALVDGNLTLHSQHTLTVTEAI